VANDSGRLRRYWRANNRLIVALLVVWGLVSFGGGILFVKPLNEFSFFGLPLGFWIAQQGAIYVFIVLIFLYAWIMDALDRRYHVDD
jgi:putative solute:sodium symporter small subunit